MHIRFIEYQPYDPYLNMAIDEAISIFVRKNITPATFRLYGWSQKALTLGEFQKLEEVNYELCRKKGIPIIRRPTGGKGILHYDDLTYSFSSRKEDKFKGNLFKNFELLSKIFANAFTSTGIDVEIKKEKRNINRSPLCFALSSFGEICFRDAKIIGSAQKRWIDGFLQQGTIPLTVNRDLLSKVFICNPQEAEKIYGIKELHYNFNIYDFQENIKNAFKQEGFDLEIGSLLAEELALAFELVQNKYLLSHSVQLF